MFVNGFWFGLGLWASCLAVVVFLTAVSLIVSIIEKAIEAMEGKPK